MNDQLAIDQLAIVVCEPSAMQRKLIARQLTQAGAQPPICVESGRAAIAAVVRSKPDLLISAMHLPDFTASELLFEIRQSPLFANLPFLLVSSESRFAQLEPIRQAGCVAILPKPFQFKDLKIALNNTLALHEFEEIELEHYDVQSLRVLIVDDSKFARRHIQSVLEGMGVIKFTTAEDGVQGLAALRDAEFDFVVTDYNMPNMNGDEFIHHARQSLQLQSIPIVMVTSDDNNARLANVQQAGVSAICDKPFDPIHVRRLVKQILDDDMEARDRVSNDNISSHDNISGTG